MNKIDIKICVGSRCTMMGAMNILDSVETLKGENPDFNINISTIKCLKDCKNKEKNLAPVVIINGEKVCNATSATIMERMMDVMRE
ncbi:MAG: NAD(P)H-dependent oxidoreductase subunit E [Peptostreptococcaceae bacterium]|jgi:NADH:ubiquinone oxidoreductase subunit E|nr:NAD(P)H-dependent oxidoreductase subunit E [Peptostreptococcaceae bacterium]